MRRCCRPAQNAAPKDLFVKSSRSFDVGDGDKVCDSDPILRGHLIAFLLACTWFMDYSNSDIVSIGCLLNNYASIDQSSARVHI